MFGGTRIVWLLSPCVLGLTLLTAVPASALPVGCGSGTRPLLSCNDPGDDGPVTPPAPTRPGIGAKTTASLEVRWNGTSKAGKPYRLLRTEPGGPVVIASGTAPATIVSATDTGLLKDTVYCYEAEVDEPNFGPLRSEHICGYTLAGQSVIRLQIELTTADISDANTDDSVFVDINGQRTWLDHNIDDRERGDTHRYDLALVGDTADIRYVTLGKEGSDGWCVAGLALLVNGFSMFQKSFTDMPDGCLWLDNEGGASLTYLITPPELRAHPNWANYHTPFPELTKTANGYTGSFQISAAELSERIEGIVGNAINGTALYWPESGTGVEIAAQPDQANAVHVTVHLKGDVFGPDATITIQFDLVFGLSQAAFGKPIDVAITDANLNVHSTDSWDDDGVEDGVRDAWPVIDMGFQIDVDAILQPLVATFPDLQAYLGRCCDAFAVEVDAQGNVKLSASLSPAPSSGGVFTWPGTWVFKKFRAMGRQ